MGDAGALALHAWISEFKYPAPVLKRWMCSMSATLVLWCVGMASWVGEACWLLAELQIQWGPWLKKKDGKWQNRMPGIYIKCTHASHREERLLRVALCYIIWLVPWNGQILWKILMLKFIQEEIYEAGIVAHTFHPSTCETEAGGSLSLMPT